ncbi:MAG: DUF4365 domain-containing protein [Cyanobacteriota bacterium]|nr:DUF4365 domain-containing protein [Cyanobacteriota bacterium]
MATKEAWYIGQRSEALAIMYLTRHDDLIVSRQKQEHGLDFLVTLLKDGGYSGRLFGVQVKATVSTPKLVQRDDIIEIKIDRGSLQSLAELPFPVCLLFFTLENDQGYNKWILEPVIETQHNSKLFFNKSNEFKKLTDEEINSIISAVNNWYESRNQ